MADNRLSRIRNRLIKEGFSNAVFNLFVRKYKWPSDEKGTLKRYQDVWSSFVSFCQKDPERALEFRREDVSNFAAMLFDKGHSGSAVNAAITALDSTRAVILPLSPPLSQDSLIASIRKSAKLQRPPPRDSLPPVYYDPLLVFKNLASSCKAVGKAKVHLLRAKLETLMLLDGGLRGNELCRVFTENIRLFPKRVDIKIPWPKEKKKKEWARISLHCSCSAKKLENKMGGRNEDDAFTESDTPLWRRLCCSFCCFRSYYLHDTVRKRRSKCEKISYESMEGTKLGTPFLVTHKSKARLISLPSIRKEVASRLRGANIDPIWTVHSIRGAGVSKLYNLGVCMDRCVEYGRWSNRDTREILSKKS